MTKKKLSIRSSAAEFLIFEKQRHADSVEVYYESGTLWMTQKMMGKLFDCSSENIIMHLKNIFDSHELEEEAVTKKSLATVSDGKNYMTKFYSLFGKRGEGRYVRIIESEDPMGSAMDFFEKISNGAKIGTMNNESALYCHLNDGVRINFRPYSSSPGSPAVDIHIVQMDKIQKIHFVLRELL